MNQKQSAIQTVQVVERAQAQSAMPLGQGLAGRGRRNTKSGMTAAKYANMKTKSALPDAGPTDGARRSSTAGVNDRATSAKTSGHRYSLQKDAELVAYLE